MKEVFHRLATEWDGYKATGKSMIAPFPHLYEVHGGRIVRMKHIVGSAIVHAAPEPGV